MSKKFFALTAGAALLFAVSLVHNASAADKVRICHFTNQPDPNEPGKCVAQVIEVSSNSLDGHLAHGDAVPSSPPPLGPLPGQACRRDR